MPIEIVERGTPKSERVVLFRCEECGSTLKAAEKDGKYHSCQREGDTVEFKCPVCGDRIYVAAGKFRRA